MAVRPEATDSELVAYAREASLEAFNLLVDRYQGQVYGLCIRLLGQREAAEDAAQETFLSAYRSVRTFREGNVRSWFLRIAANACKDELRRRGRKDRALSLDEPTGEGDALLDPPDPNETPSDHAERRELSATLEAALAAIAFEQRQAIVLVDVFGFRYEEVAAMTNTSTGTVKSRIHRGREQLRAILGDRHGTNRAEAASG